MSVRDAVASKAVEVAGPAEVNPATLVRESIERASKSFAQVLPAAESPDRFARIVIAAVKSTPDLMRCFETQQGQTSVLLAAMNAAAIGLTPNTPTQDCWLTPRKIKGVYEAQLTIGYRGKRKLMRRSGNVQTIFAEVVYEADHFEWRRDFDRDTLVHDPAEGDRGEMSYVYAVVRYHGGGHDAALLTREQVESRRALSDTWKADQRRLRGNRSAPVYSPWSVWPEDMWKKSAIHELSKIADLSAEVVTALATDEARLVVNEDEHTIEPATYDPEDYPAVDWDDDDPGRPFDDAIDVRGSGAESPAAPAPDPVTSEGAPTREDGGSVDDGVTNPSETLSGDGQAEPDAPSTAAGAAGADPELSPGSAPASTASIKELEVLLRGKGLKTKPEQVARVNSWLEEQGDDPVTRLVELDESACALVIESLKPEIPRDRTQAEERD